MKIAGLNLAEEKLYFNLEFPLLSPNIGKHYPSADYLRFSYEFYQIPTNIVEVDNPNEAKTEEGRAFQQICTLINQVNAGYNWSTSYQPIAKNPLIVSNIIYKKVKEMGHNRILEE